VFVHVLTDGRDTSPTGGVAFAGTLEREMHRLKTGRIASVSGRYYAMDRDRRWDRTERAYDALVLGEGRTASHSAIGIIEASYERGVTDEFIEPSIVSDADGRPVATIQDDDSVVFFNFRADRARQLTRALAFRDFDGFDRRRHPRVDLTTLTEYDQTFGLSVAFEPQLFSGNLAEILTGYGLTNLRLAETEKYAHVTYFFNCGEERPYPGEERVLVPSPRVATYDLQPEMSAPEITDVLVQDLGERRHDVVICNFANADMVGHTGRIDAAVVAVETLDRSLGDIVKAVQGAGGTLLVTADHGNAELMWDPVTKAVHTAHTTNPVPFVLVDGVRGMGLREGGSLRDVAPTILGILGITPPTDMTGRDLRML
jgi:2,3-bisphosphoglycerate-independent phosphoglycerate mutase